jgi:endonuclease/exonuclease/phosphatase family metal-dependent hydrolase
MWMAEPRSRAVTRRFAAPLLASSLFLAGCVGTFQAGTPGAVPSCRSRFAPAAPDQVIDWRLPPESAEQERLDPWCAAVGGPAVLSARSAGPSRPVDSLVLVTWNTHGGGGELARLVSDLRSGALTGGSPVEDFVLLLQEVHRAGASLPEDLAGARVPAAVREHPAEGDRQDVMEAAGELGLAAFYVPSMRNGAEIGVAAEDRGNAVLSTLPLQGLRAVELPVESQRRVAVAATVAGVGRAGPWELTVVSAHLDTRSTGTRLWASLGAGRRRQAERLVDGLPGHAPMVLAGDLNTWSLGLLESTVGYLLSRFPETPPAPDGATFGTGWGYARRLDHMFFRLPDGWKARQRRVDDRYGSDHHPLLGWVVVGHDFPAFARAPGAAAGRP